MRFGAFFPPVHPARTNPTLALSRDLDLIETLDRLGYDEAWFGEHHSTGWEIVGSPELMVATAAARTSRIQLGTGVISVPYHHPFLVADRMVLLDHLTRGRALFGVGPGALPSDSHMLGLDPRAQRAMLAEGMDVIVRLLAGEAVTERSEWFTLEDAQLQLRPFSQPRMEIVVAAMTSPSGPELAARLGAGLLSIGATQQSGFDVLGRHWDLLQRTAAGVGTEVSRESWRLVGPMHVAETEEQARREVAYGLEDWFDYFRRVNALPLSGKGETVAEMIDSLNAEGLGVIGTPEMACAQIDRLLAHTGGFGTYVVMGHEWADPAATRRSFELIADQVFPRYQGSARQRLRSEEWVAERRQALIGKAKGAVIAAIKERDREVGK
ncbi:MAG: LLM class flavin-dependent oxidoreductase [Actinobacteria bacterium]|nr:LLM class flavin-dependent oxidoreductase [Actinomycetota bacterium]